MRLLFFKLDGVRGESYAPRHIGEMELTSFTWADSSQHGAGGGGGGRGKATINDLTVFKTSDKTTPILRAASHNGQYFKSGELTIEDVNERGGLLRTMVFKMQDILVKFVTTNGGMDSIGIDYQTAVMKDY